MTENTKIEWADHTFNPWVGCQKVGPGCDHCYAEGWAKRSGLVTWGPGADRRLTSPANWRQPLKWNAQAAASGTRPRVFCASLADVFDNAVPATWRSGIWDLITQTPHLDWLLLTKRPGNIADMLPTSWGPKGWPNVWLGCTVVNQAEADRDIPKLLAVPAQVHFLSLEPLLGPIDLWRWAGVHHHPDNDLDAAQSRAAIEAVLKAARRQMRKIHGRSSGIDWVIAGGESGPKARPMHPDWVRNLRDQCQAAGVPFLFKQWGEWTTATREVCPDSSMSRNKAIWLGQDGTQAKPSCLGLDNPIAVIRIGKARAGRFLDGREWNDLPGVDHA
jgi:protein gp37